MAACLLVLSGLGVVHKHLYLPFTLALFEGRLTTKQLYSGTWHWEALPLPDSLSHSRLFPGRKYDGASAEAAVGLGLWRVSLWWSVVMG